MAVAISLETLNFKINMTTVVPNTDKILEPGLPGSQVWVCPGMVLTLRGVLRKKSIIMDSLLGKEKSKSLYLLQGFHLHVLDQVSQLGDRDPLFVLSFASISPVALTTATND